MEAAPESDDLVLPRVRHREAERRLDRLRAAAVELRAAEVAGREAGDQTQQTEAALGGEAADRDAPQLRFDRGDVARVRVAETRDGDAGEEIEIGVAVDVGHARALAGRQRELREQRDTLLPGGDDVPLVTEERA